MKTKIKYDVLYYDGRRGKKTVEYDCPDFEEKIFKKFFHIDLPEPITVTVEKQIDSWVGEFDKAVWMNENDIDIIFNWKVVSAKTTKSNVELIVSQKKLSNEDLIKIFTTMIEDERIRLDFIAVYSKMKPVIKDFHYEKQINIVMASQSVGYQSVIASFGRLDEMGRERKNEKQLNQNNYDKETITLDS